MNPITKLNRLLLGIERAGLGDVAMKGSEHAFNTAWSISGKKEDLPNTWPLDEEMELAYSEDTMETARVLSNPTNWGISDPAWKDFCKEWNNDQRSTT